MKGLLSYASLFLSAIILLIMTTPIYSDALDNTNVISVPDGHIGDHFEQKQSDIATDENISYASSCTQGHDYKNAQYFWLKMPDGNYSCFVSGECCVCGKSLTSCVNVTYIGSMVTRNPTCVDNGQIQYSCNLSDGYNLWTVSYETDIPKTDHQYTGEITYKWGTNHTYCEGTIKCSNYRRCYSKKICTSKDITSVVTKNATCNMTGIRTYTAKFSAPFENQTTTDIIMFMSPDLTHSYKTPKYVWSSDGKRCTASTTCTRCYEKATENAVVTSEVIKPSTCIEKGTILYTANFSYKPPSSTKTLFTTQTKEVTDTDFGDHLFDKPTYLWSDDGNSCEASAICVYDPSHTKEENGSITSIVTSYPTCKSKGTTEYTAHFSDDLFDTQTKTIDDIEMTDHNVVIADEIPATCTEKGLSEGSYCSFCGEIIRLQEEIPPIGHSPDDIVQENIIGPSCTENGTYDNVIYCKGCGEELSRETAVSSALGHSFGNWTITKEPTTNSQGERTGICSICGYIKTEPLDALPAKIPTVSIKTAFGGRTVQLNCEDSDATIYYNFGSSNITTSSNSVKSGETIFLDTPMTGNLAAMYFKAYRDGKWSSLGKWGVLNVQIAKPLITQSGAKGANNFKVYTQTKDSYIIYTLDGSTPAIQEGTQKLTITNGRIIWGTSGIVNIPKGKTIKAIAIRNGLVTSDVMTFKNK